MKQIIIFIALSSILVSCEKSSVQLKTTSATGIEQNATPAEKSLINMPLTGTWRLTEYFADDGTGAGTWIAADFKETISFGDDGEFSFSKTFPLYYCNYQSYITENDGFVYFLPAVLSNGMADTYRYVLESPTSLVFFPICRENCMRRYELMTTSEEEEE